MAVISHHGTLLHPVSIPLIYLDLILDGVAFLSHTLGENGQLREPREVNRLLYPFGTFGSNHMAWITK